MLRHMTVRFEKLDPGVKGKFDKRNGAIILSDSLFGKGPETLLHEIQHIIQKYEGFQGGTSPEYWARRDYESGDRLQERLQQEYDDILNGLTKEEQNDYIRYQEIDGELERLFYSEKPGDTEKYDRMDAEHDRLYEKLYPKEWFGKLLDLKRQMENPGEVYLGQYINSAGEIEARETASRRKMTAEERQNKMPDLGWDRALLTESSVQYSVADVMTDYGIKSINDYIGVQKAVLKKLTEDGFFADGNNVVVNQESGMTVAITKDGIRETLGKGSRFERLPSKLKKLKIATIQQIPELIKSATMLEDKVADNHGNRRNLTYAYLINSANVDGKEYVVTIVVRQSPDRNKFWMHEIRLDTKKEESDLSIRSDHSDRLQTSSKARIPYGNVSQSAENVKRENENLTTIRNLNEDDLAAMYESPGIPVKSMLEDEDGAGDVSLVLRAKDADSDSANLLDMVAVVPDSADGWLLDKLKMNGLRVVEYESGNEAARQAALEDAREMADKRLDEPKRGAKLSADRGEALRRKEEKLKAQQQKLEEEKKGVQEKYRKELTGGMRKLFNIQSYDKENLDNALEKTVLLTQQGVKLLQSERDALFETLMEMGTEVMPAEDYFSEIRAELRGRKIYVPQYVREEFGDDWNSFRKRAFGRSKIYFTDNVRDRGADVLMMEMAENYPGTFTEEYDTAEMLRQIVDAAEKGQDQRVSMCNRSTRA